MKRLAATAGIAIGPILFIIAILGVLAMVMASDSGNSFGSAGITDRVAADVAGQANLIRAKIEECHMQYLIKGKNYASAPCASDPYPCSDQTNGTAVKELTCPNDPLDGSDERSLWTGLRIASLPPPTSGFADWKYMNAGVDGGRCIWIEPSSGSASKNVVAGLTKAASKFTSDEVDYDNSSSTQKFVVFITPPEGTVDSHCTVP